MGETIKWRNIIKSINEGMIFLNNLIGILISYKYMNIYNSPNGFEIEIIIMLIIRDTHRIVISKVHDIIFIVIILV